MVNTFRAAVAWGWSTLRRVSPLVCKLFPAVAPPQQAYPFHPNVAWSLTSAEGQQTLDPNDPMQAFLIENRRRFTTGELVAPLAALASRGVTIVAHIEENGAVPAHHLITFAPSLTRHSSTNFPPANRPYRSAASASINKPA